MNAKTFFSDRPIAYHPILAKVCKSATAALFLSQIAYWSDKGADPDGWIWKTQEEMEDETGLTRSEQETARRDLKRLGLLKEERRGVPARMWYLVDWDVLTNLIAEIPQTRMRKSRKQEEPNPANYSETIAETKSETTASGDGSPATAAKKKETPKEDEPPKVDERFKRAIRAYENLGLAMNPTVAQLIQESVSEHPVEWFEEACKRAASNGKRTFSYINAIIEGFNRAGGIDDPRSKRATVTQAGTPGAAEWRFINGSWEPPSNDWVTTHAMNGEKFWDARARLIREYTEIQGARHGAHR